MESLTQILTSFLLIYFSKFTKTEHFIGHIALCIKAQIKFANFV